MDSLTTTPARQTRDHHFTPYARRTPATQGGLLSRHGSSPDLVNNETGVSSSLLNPSPKVHPILRSHLESHYSISTPIRRTSQRQKHPVASSYQGAKVEERKHNLANSSADPKIAIDTAPANGRLLKEDSGDESSVCVSTILQLMVNVMPWTR
jgi:hypothetical protein